MDSLERERERERESDPEPVSITKNQTKIVKNCFVVTVLEPSLEKEMMVSIFLFFDVAAGAPCVVDVVVGASPCRTYRCDQSDKPIRFNGIGRRCQFPRRPRRNRSVGRHFRAIAIRSGVRKTR